MCSKWGHTDKMCTGNKKILSTKNPPKEAQTEITANVELEISATDTTQTLLQDLERTPAFQVEKQTTALSLIDVREEIGMHEDTPTKDPAMNITETSLATEEWTTITRNEKYLSPRKSATISETTKGKRSPTGFQVLENVGEDVTKGLLCQEKDKKIVNETREEGELSDSDSEDEIEREKNDSQKQTNPKAGSSRGRPRGPLKKSITRKEVGGKGNKRSSSRKL